MTDDTEVEPGQLYVTSDSPHTSCAQEYALILQQI